MSQAFSLTKEFTWPDWLIVFMTASLFLPIEIATGCLALAVVFIAWKGDLISSLHTLPGKWFLLPFFLLELMVSLHYRNMEGAATIINFIGLFMYLAFYHKHIHPKLFEWVLNLCIVLSVVICIYALYQFKIVSEMGGYKFTDFVIQNSPKRRITGTFQNANIFAMFLELVLAITLYRFLKTENRIVKVIYVPVAIFLFFVMALTGCRAALIPLVFVIPVLLKQARAKKLLIIYAVALVCVVIAVIIKPDIIPRIDDIGTIQSRIKIWKTAWKAFLDAPFFGRGPWTYHQIYAMYEGHKAVHAHNIFLDSLLSFGIVGTTLLGLVAVCIIRGILKVRTLNPLLYGLMVSALLIIGIHGLVDGTLHPAKVMMLACMIWMNHSDLPSGIENDIF